MTNKRRTNSRSRTFCRASFPLEWPKGKERRETEFAEPNCKHPLSLPLSPSFSRGMRETEGDFPRRQPAALARLTPSLGPQSKQSAHNLAPQGLADSAFLLALASRDNHGKNCKHLFLRAVFPRKPREKKPRLGFCTVLSRRIAGNSRNDSRLDCDIVRNAAQCFPAKRREEKPVLEFLPL